MSDDRITVRLNGKEYQTPAGSTLGDLLENLELPKAQVAVELQGDIVPRDDFDATVLRDGWSMEVVRLVGGG